VACQQVPAHARRQELERRREQLVAEIRKLEADLAKGAPWSLLREPIESRRRERDSVQKQFETLDDLAHLTSRMTDEALWRDIAGRLTDWQGLLERQPIQARQILRKLLHGRLVFTPLADLGGYDIQGEASYGKMLAGLVPVGGTPELFENGWCPRGVTPELSDVIPFHAEWRRAAVASRHQAGSHILPAVVWLPFNY
jgi:hypothetical protein